MRMIEFGRTQMQIFDSVGVRRISPDHEVMLVTVLRALLNRFERHADYPFIDTKLSMLTGADFTTPSDDAQDFKGKTAIYCWIQGRGLEALAGHARWLPACSVLPAAEKTQLAERLSKMIERVMAQMETIRGRNHGHLSFLMTPDGRAFDMDEHGRRRYIDLKDSPCNFSDLFYSKGLFAAAAFLRRDDKQAEAKDYFRRVLNSIENNTYRSDGISFDPKNRPARQSGKYFHGPRMIALGGLALMAEISGEEEWFTSGERFIRYILERHCNRGQVAGLQSCDFWEASDAQGQPWRDDGRIVCDPGHANEFVGLAGKLLLVIKQRTTRTPAQQRLLDDCQTALPQILVRSFRNGYNTQVGGLCKTFDLVARKAINSDMPWWNLPESIRAAAEMLALYPGCDCQTELFEVLAKCSNAFFNNFVNPHIHLMAYQTLDSQGKPVDVIPATADADPGYHTGLSIIDFLKCI